MSIALIPVLPNNVLDKVFEYLPPNDVHIKVYHEKHWCALEPSEYTYILPYGTTIYELKQKLLYADLEKYGWESDELNLFTCPRVEYDDDYELNDDYVFELQLIEKIKWSDCSDNDSDDDYIHDGDE